MRMRMAGTTSSPKCVFVIALVLCCVLSLLGIANAASAKTEFTVEGRVYCDNCRAQFVTRISKYMAGAKVKLECKEREGQAVTHSLEGETDATGTYRINVTGDHEEEVCEISLLKSSDPECSEVSTETALNKKSARISLAKESGISSNVRHANPLGFMVKKPDGQCTQVLKELGITAQGLV